MMSSSAWTVAGPEPLVQRFDVGEAEPRSNVLLRVVLAVVADVDVPGILVSDAVNGFLEKGLSHRDSCASSCSAALSTSSQLW